MMKDVAVDLERDNQSEMVIFFLFLSDKGGKNHVFVLYLDFQLIGENTQSNLTYNILQFALTRQYASVYL